jgi:hypothetical protein
MGSWQEHVAGYSQMGQLSCNTNGLSPSEPPGMSGYLGHVTEPWPRLGIRP